MAQYNFPNSKQFVPFTQAVYVCEKYQNFNYKVIGREHVLIRGMLQPSLLIPKYDIQIEYKLGKFPICRILGPRIKQNAPHTFDEESICTFFPKSNIWNRKMKISETILPWISDWIFYYELWKVTGIWHGESDHRHPRRLANAS